MSLTDFDQTRWGWDEATGAAVSGFAGAPVAAAVAQTADWDGPYLSATREQTSDGKEAISAYVVRGDGSIVQSEELLLAQDNYTPTDPAVACNAGGACLTLWGGIFPNDVYMITGYRLAHNLSNPTSFYQEVDGVLSNVAVASDGADFMLAWIQAGDVMLVKVPATGSIGTPKQVATISGAGAATAIGWTGTNYTILWTGDGSIHQADVSTDGDVSNAGVLSAGSGWPQSDGSTHPPLLAYDDISGQTLVAYRTPTGELAGGASSATAGAGSSSRMRASPAMT
ncbi:MAG: hypothetical protein R3A10_06695 [Caldilineaceae bacterium]